MVSPIFFTSGLLPFCWAILPMSTSIIPPWAASFMKDLSFALRAAVAGLFEVLAEAEGDGFISSFFCAAWAETPRQSPPAISATTVRETNGNSFFIELWWFMPVVARHLHFARSSGSGRGFREFLLGAYLTLRTNPTEACGRPAPGFFCRGVP